MKSSCFFNLNFELSRCYFSFSGSILYKILCIFTCICESEEKTRMTGHAKENNLHKNHLMELLNRVVEETKVESKEKVQDYPSRGRGSL